MEITIGELKEAAQKLPEPSGNFASIVVPVQKQDIDIICYLTEQAGCQNTTVVNVEFLCGRLSDLSDNSPEDIYRWYLSPRYKVVI